MCEFKICIKCNEKQTIANFNKKSSNKDGFSNVCKECNKLLSKNYYAKNKEYHKNKTALRNKKYVNENRQKIYDFLLLNPCVDCGENEPIVLDFDHRDGVDKIANISKMVHNGFSWLTIENEISKCDVRCANCHRRRTAIQQDWYKNINK